MRPSRTPRAYCNFCRNTPAGGSFDCVLSQITQPSGRLIRPPVASRSMSAAFAFLPKSQSSSTSVTIHFLPATVSESAATTCSVALVVLCVIVRMWSCTWNRSDSSGSALMASAAGLKSLFATSTVGARMPNSPAVRQLSTRKSSMISPAVVDLAFFLLTSRNHSRISRRPVSGS